MGEGPRGHPIPPKRGMAFANNTLAHLLRQLASSVERVKLDQTQNLLSITGEKGLPVTPVAEFHEFLQARFPQCRTYPYSTLVAVLIKYIRKKHPTCNLPRFSRSYRVVPSAMLANINKINEAVKMNQYKNMLLYRIRRFEGSNRLE